MPQLSRDFGREMQRSPSSFSTALRSSATRKSGTTKGCSASRVDEIEQPLFVLGEAEVVVLLVALLDLAPLGAEFAVGAALLVGEELLLPHAVEAACLSL